MSNSRANKDVKTDVVSLIDLYPDMLRAIPAVATTKQATQIMATLAKTGKFLHRLFKEDLALIKALNHAAFARDSDVNSLLFMLGNNPSLLLKSGNVVTCSGLIVEKVTIYEFLLGAGDPDLAMLVAEYFDRLPDGEAERMRQYKKYKTCIEGMASQKPYDLTELVEAIKQASSEEVTAALNKDITEPSQLCDLLKKFRQDVTLNKVTTAQMHYNYQTLILAFELYDREWGNLFRLSGNNHDKCDLVWRQVIGFLQRGLPMVDRFAFAQGFFELTQNEKPLTRKTNFQNGEGFFPDTSTFVDALSGLGFDYGIEKAVEFRGDPMGACWRVDFQNFCQIKASNLQSLCNYSKTEHKRVQFAT